MMSKQKFRYNGYTQVNELVCCDALPSSGEVTGGWATACFLYNIYTGVHTTHYIGNVRFKY